MASTTNSGIEKRSIEMVPDAERHGTPRSQFTLWFGANTQITAIVDGALAVVFGADALWAIIGLLIGNIIGGIVMALHSAQGPQLGLPQMISSRAQFGIIGAIIPLVLVVLMYIGFASTGAVLSGQAVNLIIGAQAPWIGIVIFGALTALVALLGYKYIHVLGRISSATGLLGFLFITYCVLTQVDVPGLISGSSFAFPAFLSAIALSVGWQLTYGPYVADYSRYLPRSTPSSKTFWFTFGGSVIGSQWSMTLGALIGAAAMTESGNLFVENQVAYVGDIVGGGVFAFLIFIVILLGKLTVNTLNAYGAFMCTLTILTSFGNRAAIRRWTRAVFVIGIVTLTVLVALLASADFLANFKNFVLALLMVFTPWSVINLTDYYLISKDRFDIPAFYDRHGRYGTWNWRALVAYAIGVIVQIPFLAQSFYTGPLVAKLGGADISWLVGIVVTFVLYFVLIRNNGVAPKETIYPSLEELERK
ncbi:nucleobase:cation symporter-1, NCS1 family [Brevibacterium siliguriense]|uniref:Nucleobase:cation symporter-1, NCS1 family n=1 Tax=Brevibacterium siliguriense TaxID=1136497 RepID=A0A1H1LQQ3_9MICO|nr:cytosine permease [Brevibacterium siliguriense]SDR76944.1 nucleobase:cation symporter-1, NCS1 family [Brevibacterium siliguriense]